LQSAVDSTSSDGHKTAQEIQGAHAGSGIASVLGGSSALHDDHGGFAALIHAANNPQQLPPQVVAAAHDLQAAAGSHVDFGVGSIHPALPVGHGETHVEITFPHASALPPPLNEAHHIDLPVTEPFHALHH